ncbi:MAG: glutamine synthetase family protein [Paracoccaceae bacterium]
MSESNLGWISNLGENPPIIAAACDLNGIWRGKRIHLNHLEKVLKEGIRIPISASCLDTWGSDLVNSPYLFESGDADGYGLPTAIGPVPFFSNKKDSVLIPLWLFDNKKDLSPIDPRHILNSVCKKYKELNLNPVVAFELEFYLLNENNSQNLKLENHDYTNVLSIREIEEHEVFFDELYDLCEKNNIPMDGISSENAPNQFEINLKHIADPLKAADHAIIFKRFIKGIAKRHKKIATFMAKPFPNISGSGMHVHFSLLDKNKNNVFNNNSELGSDTLKNAVGGILDSLKDSTLILAPHFNSYKRLRPGSHAPINICWGYENRTASIRIPGGDYLSKRIEHRVAGADANPYLVLSSILSSALYGITEKKEPPKPINGDTYQKKTKQIAQSWDQAINDFEKSKKNKNFYFNTFCEVFKNCKKQELEVFNSRIENYELITYLEEV